MGQTWSRWQQRRSASTLLELAPERTPGLEAALPRLDRDTLTSALRNVAAYIARKNGNVTVIAVGGAVNTLYLGSRATTHDVDFFNNHLTPTELELLVMGSKEAAQRSSLLEESWFNNHTIFFIPRDQRDALTEQAFAQRDVIFSEPGLTVLAAPWQYAFCCKLDRLSGAGINGAREYDLDDAVQYLHQYLSKDRAAAMPKTTLQEWFVQYKLRWTSATDAVVERVDRAYRATFGVGGRVIV